jgi:Uma2 family endonuclease
MTATKLRLWTVEEYHRMIEAGIFPSEDKVELLDGRIVKMSPQTPPHAATTQRIDRYLQNLLYNQAQIRVQLPVTLSTSEPEPDIAVVRIDNSYYSNIHPTTNNIFLLIEVSCSTLKYDKEEKGKIYGRDGITDYWVLDVIENLAYIYRNPTTTGYKQEIILSPNDIITPLAFPNTSISLSDLFLP